MHPIQNEMVAIQRHQHDVERANHLPTWEIAEIDARVRRPTRRTWLRRPAAR